MPTNFYMFFVTALIPMLVGAVYYHPKVLGNAWMKTNGFTLESLEGANMMKIFGLSYVLSVLLSFILSGMVIHQSGAFSMMAPEVFESGSAAQQDFNALMVKYGASERSFGHGAFHGVFTAICFVLPIIGINALFERRGWKYTFIHFGYWAISLLLMGGLLCQSLNYEPLT